MRELIAELKDLRLHGMASAWADLTAQGSSGVESSRWLLEHLLSAEATDRAMRSVRYQLTTARFPVHRDLAGFDFDISPVDRKLVMQLADMAFTEAAHNVVLVGGPGTGKSHLATAMGVSGITRHGKRVRFYCKRSANTPLPRPTPACCRCSQPVAAVTGLGRSASLAGRQLCGSSCARSRCLRVGSRSNTSFR